MHNYNYRKHHEERIIRHKRSIIKYVFHLSEKEMGRKYIGHGLSKNKIHCSCPMCKEKVSYLGYNHSDLKKIEKLKYSLNEY